MKKIILQNNIIKPGQKSWPKKTAPPIQKPVGQGKPPKLSKAQSRALGKLTKYWRSALVLEESISTFGSLVTRGLAEHRGHPFPDIHYRRRDNRYRLKTGGENVKAKS